MDAVDDLLLAEEADPQKPGTVCLPVEQDGQRHDVAADLHLCQLAAVRHRLGPAGAAAFSI